MYTRSRKPPRLQTSTYTLQIPPTRQNTPRDFLTPACLFSANPRPNASPDSPPAARSLEGSLRPRPLQQAARRKRTSPTMLRC